MWVLGFPGGVSGKEPAWQCRRQTPVWSLGLEDPLEEEIIAHSSSLAWRIPWTEEPGRLQAIGSHRVGHDWATEQNKWVLLWMQEGAFSEAKHCEWWLYYLGRPKYMFSTDRFLCIMDSLNKYLLFACVPCTRELIQTLYKDLDAHSYCPTVCYFLPLTQKFIHCQRAILVKGLWLRCVLLLRCLLILTAVCMCKWWAMCDAVGRGCGDDATPSKRLLATVTQAVLL